MTWNLLFINFYLLFKNLQSFKFLVAFTSNVLLEQSQFEFWRCLVFVCFFQFTWNITHYKIFKWEYYVRRSITSRYCSFTNLRNGENTKFKFSLSNGNPFWWILPKLTLVNSPGKFPYINSPDFLAMWQWGNVFLRFGIAVKCHCSWV